MSTFWIAFVSSLVLTGVLIVVLQRAQVWDIPNERSSHQRPTPRGGGAAVMAALVLAVVVTDANIPLSLVLGAVLLAGVGFVDDLRSLPARIRLSMQLVVGAMAAGVIAASSEPWSWSLFVLGLVGIVAYVNAFNFMDGVNGISALQAALAGGWAAWLGTRYDETVLVVAGVAIAGAALGFLPWNAAGRVFLGDVGSYGIGATVAFLALGAWSLGVPPLVALAPLTVYLADTAWVLIKRARAGESLTAPHRGHVYQRLVQGGWPHLASAAWSTSWAALACVVAAWLDGSGAWMLLVLMPAIFYLATPKFTAAMAPRGAAA